MRRAVGLAALMGASAMAGAAWAGHVPYLAPKTFSSRRDVVAVEAAMAEEATLFVPDFQIRGAGDYSVTRPDGGTDKVAVIASFKEFAAFEVPTPMEGTYRITTGERMGRAGKLARIDGVWRNVRPGPLAGAPPRPPEAAAPGAKPPEGGPIDEAALPPGAEVMTTQGFLKADLYVTRGAPTATVLAPTGKGLEIIPETHPNEAYAGEAFKVRILVDGQPLAGAGFTLAKAGSIYESQRYSHVGAAGADGRIAVTLDRPGVYVMQVQYPPLAEGAPPQPVARNLTTTLTFEVTR